MKVEAAAGRQSSGCSRGYVPEVMLAAGRKFDTYRGLACGRHLGSARTAGDLCTNPDINRRCRALFVRRVLHHLLAALALLLLSLLAGMAGYRMLEGLSWMDAFLNSAMLLGGMGPVNPRQSAAGKLFAGCYALYAGLVFIVMPALIFTPILHRVMHHFHWSEGF